MRPEVEQELAHTLLVELLAYQFASPVRWIETQDVILGEKTTERIVEVGPADTLGVMAKRTLAAKYEAYDAARSVQRQVLCYKKDGPDIYYDVEPIEDEPAAAPASGSAAPSSSSAPAAAAPVAAAAPAPGAGPAAAVADAPVGAVDSMAATRLGRGEHTAHGEQIGQLVHLRCPVQLQTLQGSEINSIEAAWKWVFHLRLRWRRYADKRRENEELLHATVDGSAENELRLRRGLTHKVDYAHIR